MVMTLKLAMKTKNVLNNCTEQDLMDCIDYIASIGQKCIEVQMLLLPKTDEGQDRIIEYALSKGIKINIHSHYGANNITDTNLENQELSVAQLKHSIDIAARHNLGVVTFHPGRLSQKGENKEEKWEFLLETVGYIAEYAKQKKVYVAIENMEKRPFELVYTIDDLNRFAKFGKNNPYFGVTIDFAHFASHQIFSPQLEKLKLPVLNVHMSQYADKKMHMPLTVENGAVDVDEVCRTLLKYGYESFVVFEIPADFNESASILISAYNKTKQSNLAQTYAKKVSI